MRIALSKKRCESTLSSFRQWRTLRGERRQARVSTPLINHTHTERGPDETRASLRCSRLSFLKQDWFGLSSERVPPGLWSRVRPVRAAPAARDVEHRAFIDDVRTDRHRTMAEPPGRARQRLVAPIARLVSCSSLGLLLGLTKETKPRPAWYHNRNKPQDPGSQE